MAGGEAAHRPDLARALIDHAGTNFVQIDAGRVGGISAARESCRHAEAKGIQFDNHTFTSMLALSASVQAYAGLEAFDLCEYPADPKPLARTVTTEWLEIDRDGCLTLRDGPGLSFTIDIERLAPYLRPRAAGHEWTGLGPKHWKTARARSLDKRHIPWIRPHRGGPASCKRCRRLRKA